MTWYLRFSVLVAVVLLKGENVAGAENVCSMTSDGDVTSIHGNEEKIVFRAKNMLVIKATENTNLKCNFMIRTKKDSEEKLSWIALKVHKYKDGYYRTYQFDMVTGVVQMRGQGIKRAKNIESDSHIWSVIGLTINKTADSTWIAENEDCGYSIRFGNLENDDVLSVEMGAQYVNDEASGPCVSETECVKSNYAAARAVYSFDGTTSGFGPGFSGFDYSADGLHIALADFQKNSVHILDLSLNHISSFASTDGPMDVAYGSDGLLYVAHFNSDDVKVYTESGKYQRSISGGALRDLSGIEAEGGLLYIALYNNAAIRVYSENGTFLTKLTDGLGSLQPQYMTLHGGSIYASGNQGSIVVLDSSDQLLKTYPAGQSPFNTKVGGIAIDSDGTKIVPDRENDVLLIVDSDDVVQGSIGGPGARLGQLSGPRLASFTPDGNIAVLDYGNNRLQIFVVPCS